MRLIRFKMLLWCLWIPAFAGMTEKKKARQIDGPKLLLGLNARA